MQPVPFGVNAGQCFTDGILKCVIERERKQFCTDAERVRRQAEQTCGAVVFRKQDTRLVEDQKPLRHTFRDLRELLLLPLKLLDLLADDQVLCADPADQRGDLRVRLALLRRSKIELI